MSLTPGSRLGHYEVATLLGAGGMGEVFRARDSRLGREVAIKALPESLAHDTERLARFEREARLLASLSHPNIAGIYGLEEAGGHRYLVLEYVEGQTLAQRLSAGPLPIDEALSVCRDIAAGVEAAHEGGVIHRDLKPGNVMITPAGGVKVLDFGLAKGGAMARDGGSDPNLSASPTMTYAATQVGMVLGTAAYMSPEQARGRSVDRRTDIWSFGCVLFECLTGQAPFEGETVSDLMARILEREPDWSRLPARVPGRVRDLIKRCLIKDAKQRVRDIGDARLELEQAIAGAVTGETPIAPAGRRGLPWWSPIAAALAAFAAAYAIRGSMHAPAAPPRRFEIAAPEEVRLTPEPSETPISPDGRTLAMVLQDSTRTPHLWLRPIDSFKWRELPGTDGAYQPFWSPDSRSLGFFAKGKLRKIDVAGGEVEVLADVRASRGGTWGPGGVILYAPTSNGPIYRVSANGGEATAITRLDSTRKEVAHRFPRFLPDGKHFLISVLGVARGLCSIEAASLDSPNRKPIVTAESGATFAPEGFLLYLRKGLLAAQRFDAGALRVSGEPISLGDSPPTPEATGSPVASVSSDGTLAYSYIPDPVVRLVWLDPQGHEIGQAPLPAGPYIGATLSPDGHSALVARIVSATQIELLLADLERGALTRLSGESEVVENFSWSRDGRQVAYSTGSSSSQSILVVPSDGSGPAQVVMAPGDDFRRVTGWTPDDKALIVERLDPQTQWDIWILPLEGDRTPRPFQKSPGDVNNSSVSPDGRWIAYNSTEAGRQEGYVQSFPTPGRRFQVTTDGTGVIGWKPDGKSLALLPTPDHIAHAVDILPGPEFRVGPTRAAFRTSDQFIAADVTRDWSRILALLPAGQAPKTRVRIVTNWTALATRH